MKLDQVSDEVLDRIVTLQASLEVDLEFEDGLECPSSPETIRLALKSARAFQEAFLTLAQIAHGSTDPVAEGTALESVKKIHSLFSDNVIPVSFG